MTKPPGKPGIAIYGSTKTNKKDTYGPKRVPLPHAPPTPPSPRLIEALRAHLWEVQRQGAGLADWNAPDFNHPSKKTLMKRIQIGPSYIWGMFCCIHRASAGSGLCFGERCERCGWGEGAGGGGGGGEGEGEGEGAGNPLRAGGGKGNETILQYHILMQGTSIGMRPISAIPWKPPSYERNRALRIGPSNICKMFPRNRCERCSE